MRGKRPECGDDLPLAREFIISFWGQNLRPCPGFQQRYLHANCRGFGDCLSCRVRE